MTASWTDRRGRGPATSEERRRTRRPNHPCSPTSVLSQARQEQGRAMVSGAAIRHDALWGCQKDITAAPETGVCWASQCV